jgi:sphingomyelin phosphodiesterase 2
MPEPLRGLTLNCWGLKYLAKHRHERLSQIGAEVASANPPPSIVALQECWTQQDDSSIREQPKHILPYGNFYFSGIMGGGLAILSKWPIESSNMLRYVLNGRPTAFFRGDWFVGKGVACAKIRVNDGTRQGRYLSVFCTHVRATTKTNGSDELAKVFCVCSYMLLMRRNRMIHTSATVQHRHGRYLA